MHGAAVKENIENQFLRKAPSKTILEKRNKKIVLKKQKQKKGTSKNQLNPVGAAVSEARPAEAGYYISLITFWKKLEFSANYYLFRKIIILAHL